MGQSLNHAPGTSAHGGAGSPWNGSRQSVRRSKRPSSQHSSSWAWPRRTPRSSWSRSRDRACSACGGAVRASGRGYVPCSRGRKGLRTVPGPAQAAVQSVAAVVRPAVPTEPIGRRRQKQKARNAAQEEPPRAEQRAAKLGRPKVQLRTALRTAEGMEAQKRRTPPPRRAAHAAVGVREGVDGMVVIGPAIARSQWQSELRAAPSVGLHHQRRRK